MGWHCHPRVTDEETEAPGTLGARAAPPPPVCFPRAQGGQTREETRPLSRHTAPQVSASGTRRPFEAGHSPLRRPLGKQENFKAEHVLSRPLPSPPWGGPNHAQPGGDAAGTAFEQPVPGQVVPGRARPLPPFSSHSPWQLLDRCWGPGPGRTGAKCSGSRKGRARKASQRQGHWNGVVEKRGEWAMAILGRDQRGKGQGPEDRTA